MLYVIVVLAVVTNWRRRWQLQTNVQEQASLRVVNFMLSYRVLFWRRGVSLEASLAYH